MELKIVEKKLSKFYSRKYCLLTGNATTSLYLCLRSLSLPNKSAVMIPNSVCPHVPLSIYKDSGSEDQIPEYPEDYVEYSDLQSIIGNIEKNIVSGSNYGGGKFNFSIIRYLGE